MPCPARVLGDDSRIFQACGAIAGFVAPASRRRFCVLLAAQKFAGETPALRTRASRSAHGSPCAMPHRARLISQARLTVDLGALPAAPLRTRRARTVEVDGQHRARNRHRPRDARPLRRNVATNWLTAARARDALRCGRAARSRAHRGWPSASAAATPRSGANIP